MKCTKCHEDRPLTQLRFRRAGMVEGIVGMARHEAVCVECQRQDREPGCDDNKGADDEWI